MLLKTLRPSPQYDFEWGSSDSGYVTEEVGELAAQGYVVTSGTFFNDDFLGDYWRYFAFRSSDSTAVYDFQWGSSDAGYVAEEVGELAAQGYVVTSGTFFNDDFLGDYWRYFAHKLAGSGAAYDFEWGSSDSGEVAEEVGELAAQGYVVTSGTFFNDDFLGDYWRYFAFKLAGSNAAYDFEWGSSDSGEVAEEVGELAAQGYVVTSGTFFNDDFLGDYWRYFAFKLAGSNAAYDFEWGHSDSGDVAEDVRELAAQGYVVTSGTFFNDDFLGDYWRYFAFRPQGD